MPLGYNSNFIVKLETSVKCARYIFIWLHRDAPLRICMYPSTLYTAQEVSRDSVT